jgi:hypothetical protein
MSMGIRWPPLSNQNKVRSQWISCRQMQALADRSPSIQPPAPVSVTVCPHSGRSALAISLRGPRQPKAGHGIRYALRSPPQRHEHPEKQSGRCYPLLSPPAADGEYHPSTHMTLATVALTTNLKWTISGPLGDVDPSCISEELPPILRRESCGDAHVEMQCHRRCSRRAHYYLSL